jgi:hypothetical protein
MQATPQHNHQHTAAGQKLQGIRMCASGGRFVWLQLTLKLAKQHHSAPGMQHTSRAT